MAGITGDSLNNTLDGTPDPDVVLGLGGNDTLNGKAGLDTLVGGVGDDLYYLYDVSIKTSGMFQTVAYDTVTELPGEGVDAVDITAVPSPLSPGVTITHYQLPANVENGRVTGAYTLTGNELANLLLGDDGEQTFFGAGGDDTMSSYGGNDRLDGGAGDDFLAAFEGDDTLDGGDGADVLKGGDGFDLLVGGAGADTLDGGANPEGTNGQGDILLGGPGDDFYEIDSSLDLADEGFVFPAFGFGGIDTIVSRADFYWDTQSVGETVIVHEMVNDIGNDGVTIVAGVFDNTLVGHSGTDILFGRGGTDTYRAGDGIDYISLSTLGLNDGNSYVGVNGVNTVIVEARMTGTTSYDIVFDYEPGKDRLDVSDYGFASEADVHAKGIDDGLGNCYFILGDGRDYLYIVGMEKAALDPADFIV